jgi:hypothetical protein
MRTRSSRPTRPSRGVCVALALGWMSSLVGDESTLDFRTAAAHTRLRGDMAAVARAAADGGDLGPPISGLLERYLGAARGSLF